MDSLKLMCLSAVHEELLSLNPSVTYNFGRVLPASLAEQCLRDDLHAIESQWRLVVSYDRLMSVNGEDQGIRYKARIVDHYTEPRMFFAYPQARPRIPARFLLEPEKDAAATDFDYSETGFWIYARLKLGGWIQSPYDPSDPPTNWGVQVTLDRTVVQANQPETWQRIHLRCHKLQYQAGLEFMVEYPQRSVLLKQIAQDHADRYLMIKAEREWKEKRNAEKKRKAESAIVIDD